MEAFYKESGRDCLDNHLDASTRSSPCLCFTCLPFNNISIFTLGINGCGVQPPPTGGGSAPPSEWNQRRFEAQVESVTLNTKRNAPFTLIPNQPSAHWTGVVAAAPSIRYDHFPGILRRLGEGRGRQRVDCRVRAETSRQAAWH